MPKVVFGLILVFIWISGVVAQTTPALYFPIDAEDVIKLDTSNLPTHFFGKDFPEQLSVFVENEEGDYPLKNAIQGRYKRQGQYLVFKPFFPFEYGTMYMIRTLKVDTDTFSYQKFCLGVKSSAEKAHVLGIFPSSKVLPENLLRFYVYFNTPMQKGEAWKYIQLIDEEGKVDEHAFMVFKQELWSADGKRLTVFFDPGRIKRGVSSNLEEGPALLEGKRYVLSISADWPDVYGQSLTKKGQKEIEVGKAYRNKILLKKWLLKKPKANSYEALEISFDRIMDHALISSMFFLKTREGKPLIGSWEILEGERQAQFIPTEKWKEGSYTLFVDSRFEDVAGNNLDNLLDQKERDKSKVEAFKTISFKI